LWTSSQQVSVLCLQVEQERPQIRILPWGPENLPGSLKDKFSVKKVFDFPENLPGSLKDKFSVKKGVDDDSFKRNRFSFSKHMVPTNVINL